MDIDLKEEGISFVTCKICGVKFQTLAKHILCIHKITLQKYTLLYNTDLFVCENKKKKTSQTCKDSKCGSWKKGVKHTVEQNQASSIRMMGNKNPFFGKKHSNKTKIKMSENHADFTGENNPLAKWLKQSPENKIVYNAICKERWVKIKQNTTKFKQFVEKLSLNSAEYLLKIQKEGKSHNNFGKNHKHGYFDSAKQNLKIYCRSSYETRLLKILDSENNGINTFTSANFYINYTDSSGQNRRYIPDFLINDTILTEVKPKSLLNYGTNPAKIKAGYEYCHNNNLIYLVITEEELLLIEKSNGKKLLELANCEKNKEI